MTSAYTTFTEALLRMAARDARPCFSYIPEGRLDPTISLSYAEVFDRSRRFGTALLENGARRGDRIAMFGQPSTDYLTAFLGAILVGLVPSPINHNFRQSETSAYLAYIDPALVIYDRTTQDVLDAVIAEGPRQWHALKIHCGACPETDVNDTNLLRWASYSPAEPYLASPDDLVMILHTSGTTALPKGVERTHAQVCSFINRWTGYAWRESDTMFSWQPFYHQAGTLTSSMTMIAAGGHTIQWERFSASKFWTIADRHRPTIAQFVPPAPTYLLLQPPSEKDTNHSIEFAVIGGRTDHWGEFVERFGINAHSPYGSTETSYVTMTGSRDDSPVAASELLNAMPYFYAGPVIPDFLEVRIMGPDREVAANTPGEIQIRGPAVFSRYFRLPEITAKSFDGEWFKTGDIGYLRDDGYLFPIDRATQIIRRSSENISPLEIEIALLQHPDVAECAVVGVADPIRGQEILACVIMRDGVLPDIPDLFAFCAGRLSAFKVPRFLEIWPDFPRTGTLKVRKERLREGAGGVIRFDRLTVNADSVPEASTETSTDISTTT